MDTGTCFLLFGHHGWEKHTRTSQLYFPNRAKDAATLRCGWAHGMPQPFWPLPWGWQRPGPHIEITLQQYDDIQKAPVSLQELKIGGIDISSEKCKGEKLKLV